MSVVLYIDQRVIIKKYNNFYLQEQYMFLYDALLEAVLAGETTIPLSEFESQYKEMCIPKPGFTSSALDKQYDVSNSHYRDKFIIFILLNKRA